MKKLIFIILTSITFLFSSCESMGMYSANPYSQPKKGTAYTISKTKDRDLNIDGYIINESEGCERWYVTETYTPSSSPLDVLFQVGYFHKDNIGFLLYEDTTVGIETYFTRQGLDLRWDWGTYERDGSLRYRYSFVIEPDGTGLYYDFALSENGTAKPRTIYKAVKY